MPSAVEYTGRPHLISSAASGADDLTNLRSASRIGRWLAGADSNHLSGSGVAIFAPSDFPHSYTRQAPSPLPSSNKSLPISSPFDGIQRRSESAMSLAVECQECGSKQRFANADEGSMARCQRCGATLGVSKKSAKFVPEKAPAKKKRKAKPNPAARLVDMDKQAVIRAGESGARMLLAALVANFAAFFVLAVAYL